MPVGFVQSPVILFDAATGKETVRLYGHHSVVNRIVFSPDGKRIYSGGHAASGHASTDGDLRIWDVEAKTELLAIRARLQPGRQTACVRKRRRDGSGLDVATGRLVHDLSTGATQSPASVAISPDGETLAAGGGNGNLHLWSMKSGQPQEPVRWHVGPVIAAALSPDGRWLASGGIDRTVQLIDRGTSQRVHTFRVNTPTTMLAFSADSQVLNIMQLPHRGMFVARERG